MLLASSGVFSFSEQTGANTNYSIDHSKKRGYKGDRITFSAAPSGTISSTGSGEEYMPPYMTVYCWQRTA